LDAVTIETGPRPEWTVIWLHGLGADGHDFEPIVPALVGADWPSMRFVFPHAPIRPVTINGGMRMRAWYDITALDLYRTQDESGIRESRSLIGGLISSERDRGVAADRIFLAGFSQGGAIALASGLTHAERLAGIVVLSAYVPIAEVLDRERRIEPERLPIFAAHGTADPVVPIALGEASRRWLSARGYPVEWRTYPMQHAVCPEEVADLREWMASRLS
jgi:phospholipase/carboxylesterase